MAKLNPEGLTFKQVTDKVKSSKATLTWLTDRYSGTVKGAKVGEDHIYFPKVNRSVFSKLDKKLLGAMVVEPIDGTENKFVLQPSNVASQEDLNGW